MCLSCDQTRRSHAKAEDEDENYPGAATRLSFRHARDLVHDNTPHLCSHQTTGLKAMRSELRCLDWPFQIVGLLCH